MSYTFESLNASLYPNGTNTSNGSYGFVGYTPPQPVYQPTPPDNSPVSSSDHLWDIGRAAFHSPARTPYESH